MWVVQAGELCLQLSGLDALQWIGDCQWQLKKRKRRRMLVQHEALNKGVR